MPDETAELHQQHWRPTAYGDHDPDLGTADVRPLTLARRTSPARSSDEIVIAVRQILAQRRPDEATIRAIKEVVTPPTVHRPVPLDPKGWPMLSHHREIGL